LQSGSAGRRGQNWLANNANAEKPVIDPNTTSSHTGHDRHQRQQHRQITEIGDHLDHAHDLYERAGGQRDGNIVAMETWVRILAAPALPSLEIQQRSLAPRTLEPLQIANDRAEQAVPLAILPLRQAAKRPDFEVASPKRTRRHPLFQSKWQSIPPRRASCAIHQNRITANENKPCKKWTLTFLPDVGMRFP